MTRRSARSRGRGRRHVTILTVTVAVGVLSCAGEVLSIGDRAVATCTEPSCASGDAAQALLPTDGDAEGVAPPPVSKTRFGLAEDIQYITGTALETALDDYAELGVAWARFQLIWNEVQPSDAATFDWTKYDTLVDGFNARGIRMLVTVSTPPMWAQRPDCMGAVETHFNCPPADPSAYATFAGAAATHFLAKGVHDWEVFPSPNLDRFWTPPDAAAYTLFLCQAHAAIHGVDPSALVLSGGTDPASASPDIDPVTFLATVYASSGAGCFDAVGFHPETAPATPPEGDGWSWMLGGAGAFGVGLRGLMESHGDAAKQIWATDFGATTATEAAGSVTEAEQAALVPVALQVWSSYSWTGPLFWFRYQDLGTDPTVGDDFYGIVRSDGSHKPAYDAYKSAAAAAGP